MVSPRLPQGCAGDTDLSTIRIRAGFYQLEVRQQFTPAFKPAF